MAAAADGLGVALESTRLAERELAAGRLVQPFTGRAAECRYVGHRLVFPAQSARHRPVALFRDWIGRELGLVYNTNPPYL